MGAADQKQPGVKSKAEWKCPHPAQVSALQPQRGEPVAGAKGIQVTRKAGLEAQRQNRPCVIAFKERDPQEKGKPSGPGFHCSALSSETLLASQRCP